MGSCSGAGGRSGGTGACSGVVLSIDKEGKAGGGSTCRHRRLDSERRTSVPVVRDPYDRPAALLVNLRRPAVRHLDERQENKQQFVWGVLFWHLGQRQVGAACLRQRPLPAIRRCQTARRLA